MMVFLLPNADKAPLLLRRNFIQIDTGYFYNGPWNQKGPEWLRSWQTLKVFSISCDG